MTITLETLASRIQGLEQQLAQVKAELQQLQSQQPPPSGPGKEIKSFGDLYGILADKGQFSEEEIDAALYRFEWEGREER